MKWKERLRHILAINLSLTTATCNWEGIHNSQFLSEGQLVWTQYQVPQVLRIPPERQDPKTPMGIESTRSTRLQQMKKEFLTGSRGLAVAISPGLSAESPEGNSNTQSFPERGVFAYFTSKCLSVRLLI